MLDQEFLHRKYSYTEIVVMLLFFRLLNVNEILAKTFEFIASKHATPVFFNHSLAFGD